MGWGGGKEVRSGLTAGKVEGTCPVTGVQALSLLSAETPALPLGRCGWLRRSPFLSLTFLIVTQNSSDDGAYAPGTG